MKLGRMSCKTILRVGANFIYIAQSQSMSAAKRSNNIFIKQIEMSKCNCFMFVGVEIVICSFIVAITIHYFFLSCDKKRLPFGVNHYPHSESSKCGPHSVISKNDSHLVL